MSISASGRAQPAQVASGGTSSSAAPASFQRDSLVWAFGKLAERAVRHFLRDASARARYARWLSEDAEQRDAELRDAELRDAELRDAEHLDAEHGAAPRIEQGLLLVGLELGTEGCLRLEARPARGQFFLLVQHPRFQAVVALSHPALSARQQCDGICLADFEGDVEQATRWALGLNTWLSKRWSRRGETARNPILN